jgi:hypothetical protein
MWFRNELSSLAEVSPYYLVCSVNTSAMQILDIFWAWESGYCLQWRGGKIWGIIMTEMLFMGVGNTDSTCIAPRFSGGSPTRQLLKLLQLELWLLSLHKLTWCTDTAVKKAKLSPKCFNLFLAQSDSTGFLGLQDYWIKVHLEYTPTYSMEQSPSREANRFSASQGIPCILWKTEGSLLHSQVHNIYTRIKNFNTRFSILFLFLSTIG